MILELTNEQFHARGGHLEPFHATVVRPWLRALWLPEFEGRYMRIDSLDDRMLEVCSTRWKGEGAASIQVIHARLVRGDIVHHWIPAHVTPPVELLELAQ